MKRPSRGFTLVETLVALAVLSVGLLGAATMLLESLRAHAGALKSVDALGLVRDMADRIRANPLGGVLYDTRGPGPKSAGCSESSCDIAEAAAADLAHFASAALTLFPHGAFEAQVEYAPAIGPATPVRYSISLRWPDAREHAGTHSVALQVLAQLPVAG